LQGFVVSKALGLLQLPPVVVFLVLSHVHELPGAHESGEKFGAPFEHVDGQGGSPRVSNQEDFLLAKMGTQELSDFNAIARHAVNIFTGAGYR
jgi:hypothetical protein